MHVITCEVFRTLPDMQQVRKHVIMKKKKLSLQILKKMTKTKKKHYQYWARLIKNERISSYLALKSVI